MGGKSKKSSAAATTSSNSPDGGGKSFSEYMAIPVVSEIPPFLGNNQQMIIDQLSAGYGDLSGFPMLESYGPSNVVKLSEPLTETKNALKKGYNLSGTTGIPALDKYLGLTPPSPDGSVPTPAPTPAPSPSGEGPKPLPWIGVGN